MFQFIVKRLSYGFLVLFGVILVIFMLFNILPDPARVQLGQRGGEEELKIIREQLGLDKPMHVRFVHYLADLSPVSTLSTSPLKQKEYGYKTLFKTRKGRALVIKKPYLGRSFQTRIPVREVLMKKLPPTMILAFTAMFFALIFGIILGILAALKQNSWIDNATVSFSVLGISLPSYFSAIMLSYFIGLKMNHIFGLPMAGSLFDPITNKLQLNHLILPAFALGIRPVAIITQLTRSAMLDTLTSDYVRTARSKGLSERAVLFKHTLRNALNPVVTAATGWFASLLAGAFFVESVFNYKGLGFETIVALRAYDFPIVMGSVIISATFFVIIILLTDILYSVLDKRISLGDS